MKRKLSTVNSPFSLPTVFKAGLLLFGIPLLLIKIPLHAASSASPRPSRFGAPTPAAPVLVAPDLGRGPLSASGAPSPPKEGATPSSSTTSKTVPELPLPESGTIKGCLRPKPDQRFAVVLKSESTLDDLVAWIKAITCRRFLYNSTASNSKISIQIPDLVTGEDAYRIFLSALESMGLTVQKVGQNYKIVQGNRIKGTTPILGTTDDPPSNDQYYTKLFRLRHVGPDDLANILNKLKTPDADISTASSIRALIITDTGVNIKRWEEMIQDLDKPMANQDKMWIIHLKEAVATEVAGIITTLFGNNQNGSGGSNPNLIPRRPIYPQSPGGPSGFDSNPGSSTSPSNVAITQIVADPRSNSLILVSSEQAAQLVLGLTQKLDAKGNRGSSGQVHYYSLQNATAEGMASVLQGLGVQATISNSGAQTTTSSSSGSSSGTTAGSSSFSRPPSLPSSNPNGGPLASQNQGPFQSPVRITADTATNTLVIIANGPDYAMLETILKKIDQPRRQVFLQAAVFQVDLKKDFNLGLSYHGGVPQVGPDGQGTFLTGLQGPTVKSLTPANATGLLGFVMGLIGPQFGGTGVLSTISSYGILFNASKNDTDSQVVQKPFATAMDNQEVTLEDGSNLPFPSAITGGLPLPGAQPGLAAPLQSVERHNVSLVLKVIPHLNASSFVKLDIDLTIEDVFADNYNNLGPATNKRVIKTTTIVGDQKPVVLGGLMTHRDGKTTDKIPLLGDIPILGYLFKSKHDTSERKMLLIVITPYILRTPDDHERIYAEKTRDYIKWVESLSSFQVPEQEGTIIDYRYKPGLLDEIEKTAREADEQNLRLREAEKTQIPLPSGPIEPQTFPPAAQNSRTSSKT